MSLKDLFREKVAATNFSDKSLEAIGEETESAEYLKRFVEDRERFVPQVDYSHPENFAFFGSAEKYYEDSIKRIYQQYPYDGSKKEKISWHLTSSYFDNWFFDNEYPRTNGHALLSADGWGAVDQSLGGYGLPASVEYIQIKGGPNRDPNSSKLTKIYPSEGGTANVYDTSNNRESNLKFDLENNGVTIEFWLQKDAFPTTMFGLKTNKEVIFDLWNGQASSSADYGRLTLEISGTAASESPFYLTAQSGTAGFYNQQIGASIAGTGSLANWGHYAVSLANAASGVDVKFYVNGDLNQSTTLGSTTLGELTGSLIANIGALRASPSGSTFHGASMEGYGKLSGSIDEFRFWKTKRNSQEIGRYWFTQIGAGANTDTANTNLGVYYKFNEGITGRASTDSVVLDYSGRISNGAWTGYGSNSRSTQSAMVLANAASSEFKDPIIYSTHPLVSNLQRDKRLIGKEYDFNNNQSLVNSFPAWILDGDGDDGELRRLTQVMSSYFDTLYLQIKSISGLKDVNYVSSSVSGTWKPLPFAEKLLTSNGLVASDIFIDSEIIEQFLNRDEDREYESSVADVKNMIFQNVYNNLTYIYKSKGTEKSFRNLVRCFGVDDELIKLNLYADNVTYQLTDNYRETSYKNGYVDFNADTRFEATVHQFTNPSNDNTVSYLSGSGIAGLESGSAFTVEAEITFPKKRSTSDPSYFDTPFSKSCLFGMHTADTSLSDTDLAWASSDVANFQVFAVRNDTESKNAKFILTGSAGGYISELSSDIYRDTYDDERWVFAVRLKPVGHPMAGTVLGTSTKNYEINFYGGNATFGSVDQEFEVTGNITHDQAMQILSNPKRMFVGAHRQNFTGSVLNKTDVKVGSLRVWQDYISNEALRAHIIDPHNMGTIHPSRRAYLFENNLGTLDARQIETLALEWTFETLTGSNASGQFTVPDVSSGSISDNRFGDLSNIINRQHSGRGFDFPVSSTSSIDKIYDFAYAQQLPEILTNQDTVKVLTRDDETFTREQRPINYFYSVEKSMYQEISGDMLKWFATIKDYNNLIGEPVNRYRQEYKDLSKLRQLFFERVRNTPDFEKFTTFYKWFDSSLNEMIFQLFPASANSSEEIRNLVESHILERNKYWNKFPTLESKQDDPEAELRGVNELLYDWKTGHAPVSNQQNQNCFWWNERAEREGIISSGDTNVDSDRGQILDATVSALNRRFGTPQKFSVVKSLNLHGGVNLPTNKKSEAIPATLQPETIETIDISLGGDIDCTDGQNTPTRYGKKIRIPMDATGLTGEEFITGDKIAPFTVFSSSAGNTTLEIETNKELTNLHVDGYGDLKEKPLQGPFTEKYVGGLQYRHVGLAKQNILVPAVPPTSASADYTHQLSDGDRTSLMSVAGGSGTSATWAGYASGIYTNREALNTVDNVGAKNTINMSLTKYILYGTNYTNATITWDFGTNLLVTEARIWGDVANGAHNGGTWKWQGSTNNSSYTDIGSAFTFSGSSGFQTKIENSLYSGSFTQLSGNTTQYRYYRLLATAHPGSGGKNLTLYEADFKISTEIPAFYRLPNETEREEGFRLKIEDGTVNVMQPEKTSAGVKDLNLPRARYYRDETAKRPLNIRNIHHTTGSTIIGNYDELYQVVQTSNRRTNNRWWVRNANGALGQSSVILSDGDSFLVGTDAASEFTVQAANYVKPQRGKNPSVFVERFAAPGGADSAGDADGGPGLDALSAEYSPYSTTNYRNNLARTALNEWSIEHCGPFGTDKDVSVRSEDYNTNASYHKTNRNPIKRIQESGSTIITASVYDNFFVQHPIPQSDLQYAWITASAISAPFGYAIDPRRMPNDEQMITFVSSSDYGIDLNRSSVDLPWTGTFANTRAIWALNRETPIDFVGMHYVVDDPVSASENTLGYSGFTAVPSTVVPSYFKQIDYINKTFSNENSLIFTSKVFTNLAAFGLIGDAAVLNAINLNRNGPYGYPSWKQTRTDQHAIARHQRSNNRLDYIKPAGPDETSILRIGDQRFSITVPRPQRKKTVIEPVVTSKYKPLRSNLNMDVGEDQPRDFAIKHTYGNNISYFTHEQLNDFLEWPMLGSGRGLAIENQPPQVYDDLYDLYMDTTTPDDSNPIKEFVSLRYSETVYPRASNAFLDRTRSRIYFDVASIIGWRNSRSDRAQTGVANSQGNSLPPYTSSIWPLDGRWDGTNFISASILTLSSSVHNNSNSQLSGGFDGTGELLNNYSQFHNGNADNLNAGAMYARRQLNFEFDAGGGFKTTIAGDALWEAPTQAGKTPWHDSYDDFAEEIKRMGKDFSIIPEFNISDHVEYFLGQGSWFADLPNDVFSLDGAVVSGTDDRTTIENKTFFSLYNSSDFLKHFQVLNEDHTDEDFKKGLQLSCQSIMKFRPRDGFYPAQRTLQLATLFSQSYKNSFSIATDPDPSVQQSDFRTPLTPLFAPGIMFNTIKSGIAVDYPVMTEEFARDNARSNGSTNFLLPYPQGDGSPPASAPRPDRSAGTYVNLIGRDLGWFIDDDFDARMPFEAILDPSPYFSLYPIVDTEPHPSASVNSTASFSGVPSQEYALAAHNFFAAATDMFLSEKPVGSYTSFTSKADTSFIFEVGRTYKMDVHLTTRGRRADQFSSPAFAFYESSIDMYTLADVDPTNKLLNAEFAFGPPVKEYDLTVVGRVVYLSAAPYTPPYYDGPSKVTFEFNPNKGSYSVQDLIFELTSSYERLGVVNYNPGIQDTFAYRNAMQISSSVNLFSVVERKLFEKDATGKITAIKDGGSTQEQVWAIEPKFETPILDFRDAEVSLPISGSGSVPKGMWHQYGQLPDQSDKGVFLQISDSDDAGDFDSLADAVGFEKTFKRLGGVASEKTVAEAIVAIPIIRGNSTDPNKIQFVPLRTLEDNPNRGRQVVEGAKAAIRGENFAVDVVRQSDIDMVKGMQKFIIPPKWDFVNNPDQVRNPFIMFIFEFEHTFNQQDLVDMWQNLPPDETRIARNNIKTAVSSNSSIFSEVQKLGKNFGDLQWIVFKAKQRASINYFEKTLASKDDDDFKVAIGENPEATPSYSYNWPYDYFSLVELVKVDAEVKITKKPEGQTRREEQEEIIEIERTRRGEGT